MYERPGDCATANAAACAKLLLSPTTNVEKVFLGLNSFSIESLLFDARLVDDFVLDGLVGSLTGESNSAVPAGTRLGDVSELTSN